jgi:hypothetical protein
VRGVLGPSGPGPLHIGGMIFYISFSKSLLMKNIFKSNKGMTDNMVSGAIGILILMAVLTLVPGLLSGISDAAPPVNASNTALVAAKTSINTSSAAATTQLVLLPTVAVIVIVLGALLTLKKRD